MSEVHVEPETLGAFAEGRLDAERARRVEAHVAGCAECLEAVAAAAALGELARTAAPLEPSLARRLADLAPRRASKRRRAVSGREPAVARPSFAALAYLVPLAAAVIAGLVLLSQTRPDETKTTPLAQETRPERAPSPRPGGTPAPTPSQSPEPPRVEPTPSPSPETATPEPVPTPAVSPSNPEPSPSEPQAVAKSPTPPGSEARPEPSSPSDAQPVEVVLAQGSCTLASPRQGTGAGSRRSLRAGERTTVRRGDELAASTGARLVVRGRSDLYVKGALSLEETREGDAALVAVHVASGEALLSVQPSAAEASALLFELQAGALRGRPLPGGRALVSCSVLPDRASLASLEGAMGLGDRDGPLALELKAGQQVTAKKGARAATLKPEAARAASWTRGLAPSEEVLYRATFETSADGWDEEERRAPGFGGSAFGLGAVPSEPGQPWRFLALRTRLELDPKVHAIRFRWKTPVPADLLEVTVLRLGSSEKLVATVRPPAAKETWTLFDLDLASFAREQGSVAGDAEGLGADRKAKIILTHGTDHDPVAADFVIDDFEILARRPK
jgi:ferric-dicitrate binding protein FerR (iron transport regulator)